MILIKYSNRKKKTPTFLLRSLPLTLTPAVIKYFSGVINIHTHKKKKSLLPRIFSFATNAAFHYNTKKSNLVSPFLIKAYTMTKLVN